MNGFTSPHQGPADAPDPEPRRSVLLLGDNETADMREPLTAAATTHGTEIVATAFFEGEELTQAKFPIEHPVVVQALSTAAQQGLGVWLPFPPDFRNEVAFLGFVSVAAHLGVPLYVGRCVTPWNEQVLPGLATSDTLAIAAVSWRRFLAKVGGELLVTSLATAITESGSAA